MSARILKGITSKLNQQDYVSDSKQQFWRVFGEVEKMVAAHQRCLVVSYRNFFHAVVLDRSQQQ